LQPNYSDDVHLICFDAHAGQVDDELFRSSRRGRDSLRVIDLVGKIVIEIRVQIDDAGQDALVFDNRRGRRCIFFTYWIALELPNSRWPSSPLQDFERI